MNTELLVARPVDAWLQILPQKCILAEVPFKDFRTREEDAALVIYHTRYHNKRVLNGYAGAVPQGYFQMERDMVTGSIERAFDGLRDRGAHLIIVHPSLLTTHRAHAVLTYLAQRTDMILLTQFPDSLVYRFTHAGTRDCTIGLPTENQNI